MFLLYTGADINVCYFSQINHFCILVFFVHQPFKSAQNVIHSIIRALSSVTH